MTTASLGYDVAVTRLEAAELEAMLERAESPQLSAEAFKELSRRGAESVSGRAKALLQDTSATPALRTAAAAALGKRPATGSGQKALLEALRDPDTSLVRKAATSLGRIGDPDSLEAMTRISLEADHPASRALTFARSLIAYRHGLREHLMHAPGPERLLKLDPSAARPMVWQPLDPEELERESVNLARQLPGIRVSHERAVRFECGRAYWLVFDAQFDDAEALSSLAQRSAILAVAMRLDPCSGNHYVDEYIAANPAPEGEGELIGVRPSGAIAHSGSYKPGGEGLTFRLRATDTPYSHALELAGSLPTGAGPPVLEQASVMLSPAQAKSRRPRKDS